MSLRYALLALLRAGPMSGYDLQKQFSLSVGHVWHAADSQIYPELRKLSDEGLIEGEEQVRGERGTRRLYRVTTAGDEAFDEWMRAPLDYLRVRDSAHLKAAYLETTTPENARRFFDAHIAHWTSELTQWQRELEHIEALENPMLLRRLATTADGDRAQTIAFKHFTYEGLVSGAQAEIDWAKAGLVLVDRLAENRDERLA